MLNQSDKIYIAGHTGMVGSAIKQLLEQKGFNNLIYRTKEELDLTKESNVNEFFKKENIDYVFLAAAKVGGIHANLTYPADFIYQNIKIQTNIIHASYKNNVKKLLFLGSSCIYPKSCPQPIKEDYLLTNTLETTNEPYAIAKIAGIKMCQSYNKQYKTNYISVMPTNLYGYNDNFDLNTSHVMPAIIRKIHEAKINNKDHVTIWGTGTPKREFLFVDDLAGACFFLMNHYDSSEIINIGTGKDISIKELSFLIKELLNYQGEIYFDSSKPDGTPQKLLDISKLKSLGWSFSTSLKKGIIKTYDWYKITH